MTNLQQLKEKLERGFYLDNLYEMARLCKGLALDTTSPAPFFIMEQIFLDIARHWEDKPLIVEEAKLVEVEIIKPLKDLISGIEENVSSEQMVHLMNKVISSYMFLFE